MLKVSRKDLSFAIAQLMPRIIQGVQIEFLVKRALTQTQFLVLVALHSRNLCPMTTLAQSMHVSLPTISGIVDRLVKRGYVQRSIGEHDRRRVVVKLSKQGQLMITQFQGAVTQRWEAVLKALEQDDINDFHRIVIKLMDHLKDGK
ncbi:MAG: MarR family transcriptional regulator [Candidatus Omnitrophica bacterium]|nr:MarR family transcriptional regulator [Candidatus Omnitrophota bacterium]